MFRTLFRGFPIPTSPCKIRSSSSSTVSSTLSCPDVRVSVRPLADLEKPMARHAGLHRRLPDGGGELVVFTNRRDGSAPQRLRWRTSPDEKDAAWRRDDRPPAGAGAAEVEHPMTYMTSAAFGPREHVLAGAAASVSRLRRTPEAAIVRVPDAQPAQIAPVEVPHAASGGERFEFFVVAATDRPTPRLWLMGDNRYTMHGLLPWTLCAGEWRGGGAAAQLPLGAVSALQWRTAEQLGVSGALPTPTHAVSIKHWRKQICLAGVDDALYAFSYDELIRVHRLQLDSMRWTELPRIGRIADSPLFQLGMTATAVGNFIVLVGGGDSSAANCGVHVFDTVTESWCPVSVDLPQGLRAADIGHRQLHSATAVSDRDLVLVGGEKDGWLRTRELSSALMLTLN